MFSLYTLKKHKYMQTVQLYISDIVLPCAEIPWDEQESTCGSRSCYVEFVSH